MTMQTPHSPKPKIFGEGYGKHVAYNYRLMKRFFWLGWKMLVNMLIPEAFYERAHWEVINLFYKMRGHRHGTNSDHRCDKCGADLPSADEVQIQRDELKLLEQECKRTEEFDRAMDKCRAENESEENDIILTNPSRPGIAKYEIDTSENK